VYKLFFNYACAQAFDFIEDGVEGEKVNTTYHSNIAAVALNELNGFIGPDPDNVTCTSVNTNFNFSDY
jgi:hypothetical protein